MILRKIVLTEAVSYTSPEIERLLATLPQEVTDILKMNRDADSSENGISPTIQPQNWQMAVEACREANQINTVCHLFLLFKNDTQWKMDFNTKMSPILDSMIRVISEIGFQENSNPFLVWINNYYRTTALIFTKEMFVFLNNLYAKQIVDYQEIADKKSCMLLQSDLFWSDPKYLTTDGEAMVSTYVFVKDNYSKCGDLSVASDNTNIEKIRKNIVDKLGESYRTTELVKYIFFVNGADTTKLFDYYSINAFVNKYFGSDGVTTRGASEEAEISRLTGEESRKIKTAIKDAIDKGIIPKNLVLSYKNDVLAEIKKVIDSIR